MVISGTNRKGSRTRVVAEKYCEILKEKGAVVEFLSLEDLPGDFLDSTMYESRSEYVENIVETKIKAVDKYIFVMPEYNGGFPGVLKLFIDGVSPTDFYHKKAALIGLSSGKQGNSRGMDAFTNVLNYMRVNVMFRKPKLSGIESVMPNGTLDDNGILNLLDEHAAEFIAF